MYRILSIPLLKENYMYFLQLEKNGTGKHNVLFAQNYAC